MQQEPPARRLVAQFRPSQLDSFQLTFGLLGKAVHPILIAAVIRAELRVQLLPGNGDGLTQIAHPVGEPGIKVDPERRALDGFENAHIDREGIIHDHIEEALSEDDRALPKRALFGAFLVPPEIIVVGDVQLAHALAVLLRVKGNNARGKEPLDLLAQLGN